MISLIFILKRILIKYYCGAEVPEEKFDGRCLYDQLKQNRDKKDEEFAEVNKFGYYNIK